MATVRSARRLEGAITVPGDKSISHRALILGAVASGDSRVRGLSAGADVQSTASCLGALGVEIDGSIVRGRGMGGLRASSGPLDCGNSGTTMRLLAGLLAAQGFSSELMGDESLSRRPMDRVVDPLRQMGATAAWPPLRVGAGQGLHGIEYHPPVPSAQVKSAVLLAGLYAEGKTSVIETVKTRDHTELMLEAMGATVTVDGLTVELERTASLAPLDIDVPGDFSAAAFWLVAAGIVSESKVKLVGVGVNPTRTALVDLLTTAGFHLARSKPRFEAREPVADLHVRPAGDLRPLRIEGGMAAEMIDELPVLAVAATQIAGTSVISGAGELRMKESDRVAAMEAGLNAMGADVVAQADGWIIRGPRRLEGARVDSVGDHRVAMALAVAALIADGKTEIEGAECVEISYPAFFDHLEYLA
ncbi:MAG: 3-phosphoshikimate 1-carboxyvinyltransferase [Actinobacteria bacterium 13_1_40CM_2_66_13]|nr:MAG: 3-phosphoshikimate 1-carboxyvinyltransferase [Actinobacteria bacterium 13_1_40CM_2_66_13]